MIIFYTKHLSSCAWVTLLKYYNPHILLERTWIRTLYGQGLFISLLVVSLLQCMLWLDLNENNDHFHYETIQFKALTQVSVYPDFGSVPNERAEFLSQFKPISSRIMFQ